MASGSVDKRALLISPSYDLLPLEDKLYGTAADIEFMRKLTKDLSFSVTEVVGENATKFNILQALDELSKAATHGSVVLLYYTGHGFCLPNPKDEGLVPADATKKMLKDSPVDVCITGLDFYPHLTLLSKKRVKCTLIFDCCHSGQMYRVLDLEEVRTDAKPRHITLDVNYQEKEKSSSGGWMPKNTDYFVHIAACSSVQTALEYPGGGRLTIAIARVIDSLDGLENVSHQAFFRLIKREFKRRGWDQKQTPQIEGSNFDRELLGVNNVPSFPRGIPVSEVNGNEVILSAGYLQNLLPGKYDVFKTTVTEEGVRLGCKSSEWRGTVDVNEGCIAHAEASGIIVSHGEQISHGCLAYLVTPGSVLSNVLVQVSPDTVPSEKIDALMTQLQGTKLMGVSREALKIQDEDLITIIIETFPTYLDGGQVWVARRGGLVIVPPLSVGQEKTMAENLGRYLRYNLAHSRAEPPPRDHESFLKNVSFVMKRKEKVGPISDVPELKTSLIQKGLKEGQDMYPPTACDQPPCLTSHLLKEESTTKFKTGTGDAFVFQVKNCNKEKEEDVHICVLVFQFDGAIELIYPFSGGDTIPLGAGDTVEKICRVLIPQSSLRNMAQPDPSLPEPNKGLDTVVLYATSKPMKFGALLQGAIEVDSKLMPKGRGQKKTELTDLETFLLSLDRRRFVNVKDAMDGNPLKYVIMKKAFNVVKNSADK